MNGKLSHPRESEFLKELLERGHLQSINATDNFGGSALHWAAAQGNVAMTEWLLEHGGFTQADAKNRIGETALHAAAFWGHCNSTRAIVGHQRFTQVNAVDVDGRTALHDAVQAGGKGCLDVVRELLTNKRFTGADVQDKFGKSAMQYASEQGDKAVLAFISGQEQTCAGDINAANTEGYPALHEALLNDNFDLAKNILRDPGLDLNTKAGDNSTALHWASHKGQVEIVKTILQDKRFTEVHAKDCDGKVALHYAIMDDYISIAKMLREHGEAKPCPLYNGTSPGAGMAALDNVIQPTGLVPGQVLPLTVGVGTCLVPNDAEMLKQLAQVGMATVDCGQQVDWAFRVGYRLVDTAQRYGNEEAIGRVLKEAVASRCLQRDDVYIVTKIWVENMGYQKTLSSFQQSLRSLQVASVDLVLVHWPSDFGRTTDVAKVRELRKETWKAMELLVQQGKVTSIGVANYSKRHLEELAEYASIPPAVNQIEIHPYCAQFDLVDYCQGKGIAVMAYSPLGGCNAAGPGTGVTEKLLQDQSLRAIAMAHGKTVAQVILRWVLQRGVTPIPKASSESRLRENLGALQFELNPADMKKISSLDRKEFVCTDSAKML
eukprot:gnl/MRDRNA2_/MRDRNA2_25323_c0_seq1.p1 gnl/MRDRNA2_/MRDRNA2_25323_c0~~gnl/MRDRNA2_/MRDRNA2_25323_c0_seq1.p1  ORF type:complete len:605 (+),score=108.13 gnl/MRDRNA2_/MRDRNA2_25323_c0_seq1:41-1855(+)